MSDADDPATRSGAKTDKAAARAERERRLAEALRRNLKRRKAQSRGRTERDGEPPQGRDRDT
jgi:hypothetical protein